MKMITNYWDWVTDEKLMDNITDLDNELCGHGLVLGYSMVDGGEFVFDLQVGSEDDEKVSIVCLESVNFNEQSSIKELRKTLKVLSHRIEFLTFVINSIVKMKESDEFLKIDSLEFDSMAKKHVVEFEFSKGLDINGRGQFHYNTRDDAVELKLYTNGIDTQRTSMDISDLPKDLVLSLNVVSIDGYNTLTVDATYSNTYSSIDGEFIEVDEDGLVMDVTKVLDYLEKL